MQKQPGLTDAVITEIDDNSIRIEVQDAVIIVTYSGKVTSIGGTGEISDELREQIHGAVDAALYPC